MPPVTSKSKTKNHREIYRRLKELGLQNKYLTYKPGPGSIDILQIKEATGEVEFVPLEELTNEIIKLAHFNKGVDIGPSDARHMAHWWTVINHQESGLKDLPQPICTKSEKVLAFRRLPFDYISYQTQKAPRHFLELCNRMSDPDTFQAFIGSIFVPESYRQQYLYLFGHGNDGKGTLFNLLNRMLGQTFVAEDAPDNSSPFWASVLVGKRLCVFPELDDPKFPLTARAKKMTGDDSMRIEEKFKKAHHMRIFTKFIFASNDELQITKRKADRRRALYIGIKSFTGTGDPNYLDKLWAEAPAIYALCVEKYHQICAGHGAIPQHTEKKTTIDFDHENEMDRFFNKYFEPSPTGKITGAQWQAAKYDYFGRKPSRQEESILKEELVERKYDRVKKTEGWFIFGLKHRSRLAIIHDNHLEIPFRKADFTDV